jgi:hypothetical protein
MLTQRLKPFRNREAAHKLARWISWKNAGPRRCGQPFPLLRETLKNVRDLDLTENEIRGAIRTLLAIEFVTALMSKGSAFERTVHTTSGVRRKMRWYRFGPEFQAAFAFMLRINSPTLRGMQNYKEEKKKEILCIPQRVGEFAPRSPIICRPTEQTRVPGFDEHLAALVAGPQLQHGAREQGVIQSTRPLAIGEEPFIAYLTERKATQTRVERMGGFSGNGRLAGDGHDLGAVAYALDDTIPGLVDSTGHVQADPGILERHLNARKR